MENHNEIFEKLGKLETGIDFLVEDAKKKNGYIKDLTEGVAANKSDIDKMKGGAKVINVLWGVLIATLGVIIAWYKR